MLDYKQLLSKIYDDEKIEFVLEALGCHSIHSEQNGNLIVAGRPESNNRRAVQIKNTEELKGAIRTNGVYGDLYDVVLELQEFKHMSDAKSYLMTVCGYDENTHYEESPLTWLNRIKRQRKHYNIDYEMNIIDEEVLDQFLYGNIKQFTDDNISVESLIKFKIGYDVITKRITIPIRDKDGNLCGIKGRATTKEDTEYWKFFFLYKCDQSKTMFNYYRAKEHCQDEVKVFESEKAPIQMEEMGILDAVGVGSSGISTQQLNLLLNLNCDIVLCFDEGSELDKIFEPFINFFKGKRNVWALVDDGTMPKKSSPSDNGIEMWNRLYQNKILLCEGE